MLYYPFNFKLQLEENSQFNMKSSNVETKSKLKIFEEPQTLDQGNLSPNLITFKNGVDIFISTDLNYQNMKLNFRALEGDISGSSLGKHSF